MCGIAGFIGRGDAPTPDRVHETLGLMRHRGPDHTGTREWDAPGGARVTLLHSRLSIIDLDPRGNQPFRLGGRWLSYNGELYNYLEVRAALEREGESFTTETDTEVLLRAIAHWGWEGLDRCEGMWGFAHYDESTGTLTLSRDRFQEKPLYVLRDDDGLWFGSEVKLIQALRGRPFEVNHRHLYRYLVNGYKSLYKHDETFFTGVEELPGGALLHISPEGERLERFWEPRVPERDADMTFEDAAAGVRERLIRSVDMRLRADVPLAFAMSGGVDSLSLISAARKVCGYDVHGFTIVNEDERYEEQEMVDLAVRELGIRHTPVPLDTAGFLPRLRELVRHHDAPVYTIAHFAQWLLMEAIGAEGYKVVVSGTAADELFTGYYDHHLQYLYEVRNQPAVAGPARAAWAEHVRPVVRNPYLQDPDYFVADPSRRDHIFLGADEFAGFLKVPFDEPFHERDFGDGLLRNRMLNELFHEAVPVILHEEDLNAMYFSIENRSPFLDRELFEFALRIPVKHLVQDGKAKAVLRAAMSGIAPAAVLENRRKVGFNAPIDAFLDTGDPEVRDALLADSPIFDHIHREPIQELVDAEWLPNSRSKLLFYFLNAKLFLEEFGG